MAPLAVPLIPCASPGAMSFSGETQLVLLLPSLRQASVSRRDDNPALAWWLGCGRGPTPTKPVLFQGSGQVSTCTWQESERPIKANTPRFLSSVLCDVSTMRIRPQENWHGGTEEHGSLGTGGQVDDQMDASLHSRGRASLNRLCRTSHLQ